MCYSAKAVAVIRSLPGYNECATGELLRQARGGRCLEMDGPECQLDWSRCPINQRLEDFWRALDEREKRFLEQADASRDALRVAREALEYRLAMLDDLHKRLDSQAVTFATQTMLVASEEKQRIINMQYSENISRAVRTQDRMIGYMLGAAMVAGTFSTGLTLFVRMFWE